MKDIPLKYRDEFLEKQLAFTRQRLDVFALAFAAVFSFIALVISILNGGRTPGFFLETWVVFIAVSLLLILLSRKASSVRQIKAGTVFLLAVLFLTITSNSVYFEKCMGLTMMTYLLVFFSTSLIIPWLPRDLFVIGGFAITAFSVYYFNGAKFVLKDFTGNAAFMGYAEGVAILFLAYMVCFFVTKYDFKQNKEMFLLVKRIKEDMRRVKRELELATRVHSRFVPRSGVYDKADVAVTYLPMSDLGGDYGNYRFIDGNRLFLFICDVSGHGVPAALIGSVIHNEIENLISEGFEPGLLLNKLAEHIYASNLEKTQMMLSAFCGLLDLESGRLLYSNHGHPPQYLYRKNAHGLELLKAQTCGIGFEEHYDQIYQTEVMLGHGDNIILFTDGIYESRDAAGEEYGLSRLEDFIARRHDFYPNVFNEKLMHELVDFTGNVFRDDIFMMNINYK